LSVAACALGFLTSSEMYSLISIGSLISAELMVQGSESSK
jgi:hypothetical protein